MNRRPILEVSGLSKSFGGVKALTDASFELRKNEILGVIGPNGSGKTTLANLITRFVRPSAGSVHFMGRPIHHLPAHAWPDWASPGRFRWCARFTNCRPTRT